MVRYKSISLLGGVIFLFLAGCNKAPTQTAPQTATSVKINTEQPKHLEKKEMESLLNELKLKNPFSPKHFNEPIIETKKEIELEGIMWDKEKPFAVIDGTVVVEGDFIDNKKVIRINNESVILDNQGKEEILKINLKWQ
jgi:type II secretory pathway component PulC